MLTLSWGWAPGKFGAQSVLDVGTRCTLLCFNHVSLTKFLLHYYPGVILLVSFDLVLYKYSL